MSSASGVMTPCFLAHISTPAGGEAEEQFVSTGSSGMWP
jgi:hypothetical protein